MKIIDLIVQWFKQNSEKRWALALAQGFSFLKSKFSLLLVWFQQNRKKGFSIAIAGVVLFLWIANQVYSTSQTQAHLNQFQKRMNQTQPDQGQTPSVSVVAVKEQAFKDSVSAQGTVKGTKIQLRFEVAGVLEALHLQAGRQVKKGDLLGQFVADDARLKVEYRQAKLEAEESQLQVAVNKEKLFKDLYSTGYLIEAKVDEVRLNRENQEKKVKAAQLEVQSAEKEYEKIFLKAPCDGVIADRSSAAGEFLPLGTKVGEMVNLKDLYLELNIAERHINRIHPGQKVKLKTYSYQDQYFYGVIEGVVPMVEDKSRTLKAKVRLENASKLVPGMFVKSHILIYEKEKTLIVPAKALHRKGDEYFVVVLSDQEKAKWSPVKIGYVAENEVEILEGVSAGEKVVVDSPKELQEGEALHVLSRL